jgi:hypothetical protein
MENKKDIYKYLKYKNKYLEYKNKYILKGGAEAKKVEVEKVEVEKVEEVNYDTELNDNKPEKYIGETNQSNKRHGFGIFKYNHEILFYGVWVDGKFKKVLEIHNDPDNGGEEFKIRYGGVIPGIYSGKILPNENAGSLLNNFNNDLFIRVNEITSKGVPLYTLRSEYVLYQRHGSGTMFFSSNSRKYEAEWIHDKPKKSIENETTKKVTLFGTLTSTKPDTEFGTYYGDIDDNGNRHGLGQMIFKYGAEFNDEYNCGKYDGEWEDDNMNGKGIMIFINKNKNFTDDMGVKGIIKFINENGYFTYDGEWVKNEMHGIGTIIYSNGFYVGGMSKNKRNGLGKLYKKNGSVYVGTFEDDKLLRSSITYARNGIDPSDSNKRMIEFKKKSGSASMWTPITGKTDVGPKECNNPNTCRQKNDYSEVDFVPNQSRKIICSWTTATQDNCDNYNANQTRDCKDCGKIFTLDTEKFMLDDPQNEKILEYERYKIPKKKVITTSPPVKTSWINRMFGRTPK